MKNENNLIQWLSSLMTIYYMFIKKRTNKESHFGTLK